jgi:hypothetical protein
MPTEYGALMTQRELVCEACGTTVYVDIANDDVTMMREPASSPAPGRETIRVGNDIVHQCADHAFAAPGDVVNGAPR